MKRTNPSASLKHSRGPGDDPGPLPYGARAQQRYYDDKKRATALRLVRLPLTLQEVAEGADVTQDRLNSWLYGDSDFAGVLKEARQGFGARIEREGLYRRALGYEYASEKLFKTSDDEILREEITVHVPPDPGSIQFALKNLDPEHWRDKQEVDFKGQLTADDATPRQIAMAMIVAIREAQQADRLEAQLGEATT